MKILAQNHWRQYNFCAGLSNQFSDHEAMTTLFHISFGNSRGRGYWKKNIMSRIFQ